MTDLSRSARDNGATLGKRFWLLGAFPAFAGAILISLPIAVELYNLQQDGNMAKAMLPVAVETAAK